jgi:DNA-binding transcriptional regulator YiaG
MTANELATILATIDWNQSEFARRLQVGRRAVRYWINGHEPIPVAVALAVRYLATGQADPDAELRDYNALISGAADEFIARRGQGA